MQTAQSKTNRRWQTVVPAAVRQQLKVSEGDKLVWLFDGQSVRVVRLPPDPVKALRGSGWGEQLLERLLEDRRREREAEQRHAR